MSARSFLFLQGCTCPFFHALGRRLRERGHRVGRVNFNVGDALVWFAGPAWAHRGPVGELSDFLRALIVREGFTDLVMLGDTRPIHAAALAVAEALGLRVHVWEEGYFRPYWLTVERSGINGHSRLPRDPLWYRETAPRVPETPPPQPVPNPVRLLAAWELVYHLPNLLNPLLYPGYRTHRPAISGVEFAGWAWRFSRMPLFERRDLHSMHGLFAGGQRFFLFPLQLDGDSQLSQHSRFASIGEAIDLVLRSFAAHAPADRMIVVKNHPLDTGLTDYGRVVRARARELGIAQRVCYLESGHLPDLLQRTDGVIVVNSTVGTSALAAGCPVIALGNAIYAMPGLAASGGLDDFWGDPPRPDAGLFEAFRRVALYATQVNGGFYSRRGCALAVDNALRFLEPERSPLEELLS